MTRTRLTAAERGEQVLRAAITAFAESGYAATTTDDIARLAGVTQPYVIRLFGSKQKLFLAALERVCERIQAVFREAADGDPSLAGLGGAFEVFLAERELLILLLHGFAASGDVVVGDLMRERFGQIYELVRQLTGASTTEAREFVGQGMLLTVMAAMRVAGPDSVASTWARELLDDGHDAVAKP